MKSFKSILLLSVALVTARAADVVSPAKVPDSIVISSELINQLALEARANSPSIKAAAARVRSAARNAESVRTWEDPTALVGGSVFSSRGMNPAEEGNLVFGLEEKLPLWGRPESARKVAQAEAAAREAEANYLQLELRNDITEVLLTTAFAERAVELEEQDIHWLEAMVESAENRYRAGQGSLADALQIQNTLAQQRDTWTTDRRRLAQQHLNLNRLLNRDASNAWPSLQLPPVAPVIPFSAKLISLAMQNEPKLKVQEAEIRQAIAAAELTRKARLPEVSLSVEGRQYSGDGGFRSGAIALRISLPWFNGNKYSRDYSRQKELQQAAEHEREAQMLKVREELHHLSVSIEASRRESLLQSEEISLRAAEVRASRVAEWEAGRGSFREVLDARRMELESQLMAARATREQYEMLAEMLLWTGLEKLDALLALANEPEILSEHERHFSK